MVWQAKTILWVYILWHSVHGVHKTSDFMGKTHEIHKILNPVKINTHSYSSLLTNYLLISMIVI